MPGAGAGIFPAAEDSCEGSARHAKNNDEGGLPHFALVGSLREATRFVRDPVAGSASLRSHVRSLRDWPPLKTAHPCG
jgi:hypothetical protein